MKKLSQHSHSGGGRDTIYTDREGMDKGTIHIKVTRKGGLFTLRE